ncbi:RDD family protein [Gemmobacter serpentinus]|uniref:RDD family protein n=1 Tax=Gemmobacter serpentinus TaxID=2652247 RepID=UPI00124BD57C|nr:RDD family protein [Gemmobacter serpentinus]
MKSYTPTNLPAWEAKGLLRHTPPESVPITFRLSSLGARMGAQSLDIFITYGGALLIIMALATLGGLSWEGLTAFYALLSFFIRIPYYALSELVWNGRTLGKRIAGIRVISLDGRRLTPHQIVARNLMKEVEVFLPIATLFGAANLSLWPGLILATWMIATLLVPIINRLNQRIGDMVAGTVVVETPRPQLLPDLSARAATRGYEFRAEHLDIYGRFELQTLETILRNPPTSPEARKRVSEVAQTIRRRIRYDEDLPPAREWDFLLEFYRQQREYLESRNLFGDERQNKFHTAETNKG